MMGPGMGMGMGMGGRGLRPSETTDDPRNPKPRSPIEWPRFILKGFYLTIMRLAYIYKLVWEARPWIMFIMLFMTLFNGVQGIIGAYISKALFDGLSLAAMGKFQGTFWQLGSILILQIVFHFSVQIINSLNRIITRLSNEVVTYSLRLKIMNKAKTIDLSSFDLPEFYTRLENANREVGNRPLQILSSSFSVISILINMVSFIAILASIISWAPAVIIAMALPSAIIHYIYRNKMFNYVRRRSKDRRHMDYYANLLVNKDLVKEVKLFNTADMFIGRYKKVFLKYYNGVRDIIIHEGAWGMILTALRSITNGTIFVAIARMVYNRLLTVGDYSLYTTALFSISGGVSDIVDTTAGIYEGTLFIDNMISFMEEEPKIVPLLADYRRIDPQVHHEIEFRNVSFAYPGTERYVLKDINVKINSGETVVLVGLNGAGKTTFLKLLIRLYDPTEGTILFDGYDIREYNIRDIYDTFGIIFQDFGKYAFTISENIALGKLSDVDNEEKVKTAAEKSDASQFIDKLQNKYDTPLMRIFEEEGLELSIGQWQKIAVARAFFRDSDIIILDEPTASLDPMAEQEIFRQFDELRGEKTTIFVSHRLSSAVMASKIIVLEHGEIVEIGDHKTLMQKDGKYAELFNTQARRYVENMRDSERAVPE